MQAESAVHTSLSVPPFEALAPRQRVLEAAIELFAAQGFEAVTVRDITARAKTNLAAINYYFESKENLIRVVFKHAAQPMNKLRLDGLTAYEESRAGLPLELEPVLRTLVDPVIRTLMGKSVLSNLAQIFSYCVMWPPSILTLTFDEGNNDELILRYISALSSALPEWPKEDIAWAFYFATGSLFTSTRDLKKNFHFRRLTGNSMHTDDPDAVVEHLMAFLLCAFSSRTGLLRKP